MSTGGYESPVSEPIITTHENVTVYTMNDGGSPPRFAVIEMGHHVNERGNLLLEGHGPLTQEECFGAWPTSPGVPDEALQDLTYPQRHLEAQLPATDKELAAENARWLAEFILGKTTERRSQK